MQPPDLPLQQTGRWDADGRSHGITDAVTVDAVLSERYQLDVILGRGGMADVYRGLDLVLERPVAVKVIRATGETDGHRFVGEMRAMAALNHPGIVQLFDAGIHDDRPYLVMELVEGMTLPALLARGPLDAEPVRRAGCELAAALAHAHDLGVVHRDVKPANILVDGEGRTRLSDFGIARLADTTRVTEPGMTTGTAAYLAPEQLAGDDVGPRGDVYALGLVLLEALTGRQEFTGTPVEAAMARLHRDPLIPQDLPAPWPDLLAAMTAREPQERPGARQVAARLSRDGSTGAEDPAAVTAAVPPQRSTTPPAMPDATGQASRGPRRTVVVAAVLAAAAIATVLAVEERGSDGAGQPEPPDGGAAVPAELDEALDLLEDSVER